ncbi:MAG: hypothetical protein R6U04_14045 [Bacteroidales bacterium]
MDKIKLQNIVITIFITIAFILATMQIYNNYRKIQKEKATSPVIKHDETRINEDSLNEENQDNIWKDTEFMESPPKN